jgi:hypothetical protein
MALEVIEYRDWILEIDKQSTKEAYKKIGLSGAESCNCNYCKNFIAARESIYPEEVRYLFNKLGIDFSKEADASEFTKLENGLHYYSGLFHFKGRILKGKDSAVPLPSGGFTVELTEVTPNFSIGFTNDNSLSLFEEKDNLVQIDFSANVHWIIEELPEN